MELHQELEKEQNLDYYYNEEEEEEDEHEENEEGEENDEKNKKNEDKKDKQNINKAEDDKNNINNENNIINENKNKNINNIEENKEKEVNKENIIIENKIVENNDLKKEEDIKEKKLITDNTQNTQETQNSQMTENSEKAKQQIIEEIDTTIPKKNNLAENAPKEGDLIIQSFSPNTICHRLIPKGSDLDVSQKGYFQCYKIKTKSNIISFITGSKKIKVPYIIFIDENYYYMAKDKIINQRKPYLRRIGNRYDLLKLSNFQTTKKE